MRRRAVRVAASGSGAGITASHIGVLTLGKADEQSLAYELREGLRQLNEFAGPATTVSSSGRRMKTPADFRG